MWDTIKFRYEFAKQSMPVQDHFLELCDSVAPAPHKGQGAYECWYKNMHILYVGTGYIVFEGSIAKLAYGNNIQTINTSDTFRVIEQLQDHFKLLFMSCPLHRIDVSTVINTIYDPVKYFDYLMSLAIGSDLYQRDQHPHSLYYRFSTKSKYRRQHILFYDKVEEARKHNIPVPAEYEGLNLMRFEVRHLTPKSNFHRDKPIPLSELTDPHFLQLCLKDWKFKYNQITKKTIYNMPNYKEIKTPTDLRNLAELVGYLYLGEDVVHKANFSNYEYKSRAKKRVQETLASVTNLHQDPIIQELTEKVNAFELIELVNP